MNPGAADFKELSDQIEAKIWHSIGSGRACASHWDWPDKEVKERGIVCDLLNAMESTGEPHGLVRVGSFRSDPPDCVGRTESGELIAFEVSELVDQDAVEFNERVARNIIVLRKRGNRPWNAETVLEKLKVLGPHRERFVYKLWTQDELTAKIQHIVSEKDAKPLHGGPYKKVILVIHTSEPQLCFLDCGAMLSDLSFGPTKLVSDAYLLIADRTGRKSYPYTRLRLA